MTTKAGIPTLYRGIEYRSRLEARWASFFSRIGWETIYEPFDGDGYIPDFLIKGDGHLLVEVKPALAESEYRKAIPKAETGLANWSGEVLIVGFDPFAMPEGDSWYHSGLLGNPKHKNSWIKAPWTICPVCNSPQWSVMGRWWSYPVIYYPCGHSYFDDWGVLIFSDGGSNRTLRKAWADACNDVKWQAKLV